MYLAGHEISHLPLMVKHLQAGSLEDAEKRHAKGLPDLRSKEESTKSDATKSLVLKFQTR